MGRRPLVEGPRTLPWSWTVVHVVLRLPQINVKLKVEQKNFGEMVSLYMRVSSQGMIRASTRTVLGGGKVANSEAALRSKIPSPAFKIHGLCKRSVLYSREKENMGPQRTTRQTQVCKHTGEDGHASWKEGLGRPQRGLRWASGWCEVELMKQDPHWRAT